MQKFIVSILVLTSLNAIAADDKPCSDLKRIITQSSRQIQGLTKQAVNFVAASKTQHEKDVTACKIGTTLSVVAEIFMDQIEVVIYNQSTCDVGSLIKSGINQSEYNWLYDRAYNISNHVHNFCLGDRDESGAYTSHESLLKDLKELSRISLKIDDAI